MKNLRFSEAELFLFLPLPHPIFFLSFLLLFFILSSLLTLFPPYCFVLVFFVWKCKGFVQ